MKKIVVALVITILLLNVVIQTTLSSSNSNPALYIEETDGLYMLYEPPNTSRVEYTLYFANSTWKFHASTVELPTSSCQGVSGAHQWDFWLIRDFPQLYPVAHEGGNLSRPLKPEFTGNGPLAAYKNGLL